MGQAQIKQMRREARNGALDARQAEMRANPETCLVTIAGEEVPFLLSFDGFERATANGHDPLPAVFRLIDALAGKVSVKGDAQEVTAAVTAGLRANLTSAMLSDVAVLLYAGVVSFDRELAFETFRGRLTLGAVLSIASNALPRIVTFLSGLAEGMGGMVPDAGEELDGDGSHAPGDSGN
jgi:hypothetical protein